MIKFELMEIDPAYVKILGAVIIGQSKQWSRGKMLAVLDDLSEPMDSSKYKQAVRELKRGHDPSECDDQVRSGIAIAFMWKVFYQHFLDLDEATICKSLLHFGEHFEDCIKQVAEKNPVAVKGPTRK